MICHRAVAMAAMLGALLAWRISTADAHSQSYGFLNLTLQSDSLEGTVGLAVRDLDTLFDLDENHDGKITWGEFRSRETEIAKAVMDGISVSAASKACALAPRPALTDSKGGETYIIVPFDGRCAASGGTIDIGYNLLFDADAQHRGLVNLKTAAGIENFVMTPAARQVSVSLSGGGWFGRFATWVNHGIHHILVGYDHILFVLTLLLGTAVQYRSQPLWRVFREIAKVVTAFTLSHSITLGLAAFGVLHVPVALAESLIAVTIALAAANNLWPLITARIWLMALAFGLVHGIGFANVLTDLGLPRNDLLASLLAFNVGVEVGQLIIVLAAMPVVYLASRTRLGAYAVPSANVAIGAVALMWFSDRAFGTSLMPF